MLCYKRCVAVLCYNAVLRHCVANAVLEMLFYNAVLQTLRYKRCVTNAVLQTLCYKRCVTMLCYKRCVAMLCYKRCVTNDVLQTLRYKRCIFLAIPCLVFRNAGCVLELMEQVILAHLTAYKLQHSDPKLCVHRFTRLRIIHAQCYFLGRYIMSL